MEAELIRTRFGTIEGVAFVSLPEPSQTICHSAKHITGEGD